MSGEIDRTRSIQIGTLRPSRDAIVDAFERAWQVGPPPRLEEYAAELPGAPCPELLARLVQVDVMNRRQRGELPSTEDYTSRFREYSPAVEQAFANIESEGVPATKPVETSSIETLLLDGSSRRVAREQLLVGVLALQWGFVSRPCFLESLRQWLADQSTPLASRLETDAGLRGERRMLLESLVSEHVQEHEGLIQQGLAAWSGLDSIVSELARQVSPEQLATLPAFKQEGSPARHRGLGEGAARFRVLKPHAQGGLGEVYLAVDEELRRQVALKRILPQYVDNPQARARFLIEAEITGNLEHPGIVPVYGLGTYSDGRPYYAMRFIEGHSLEQAVQQFHDPQRRWRDAASRSMELRKLIARLVDVCNAIEYAHSRGVLHRDLKPSNIMLGLYGETLVVDWGVAKPLGKVDLAQHESSVPFVPSTATGSPPTRMGAVVGTPQYMSPEQADGQIDRLGPASDVYSVGATLYAVLTGQPPVPGEGSVSEVLEHVIEGRILPPRKVNPLVPRPLEAICLKAMAREPSDRYGSARRLADDLENWLADERVVAYRERPLEQVGRWARRHRAVVSGGGALLLTAVVALGVGLYLVDAERQRTEEQRRAADAAKLQEATQRQRAELAQAEEARQRALAETRRQETDDARKREAFNDYRADVQAADVAWEANQADDAFRLLDRCPVELRGWEWFYLDSKFRQRCMNFVGHSDRVMGVAFSRDGQSLASGSDDGTVKLWDTATGQEVLTFPGHGGSVPSVSFSPDGRWLAGGSDDGTVRLWDTSTGQETQTLRGHADGVVSVAFSPDGRRLASGSDDGTVRLWDTSTGQEALTLQGHTSFVASVAFSPDGTHVASGSWDQTVKIWDAETGQEARTLSGHTNNVSTVAFSPDGKQIASGGYDLTVRLWDTKTGREDRTLRGHSGSVVSVAFSPDGARVASGSWDRTVKLWDASSGQEIQRLPGHAGSVQSVAFSPDGWRVASASEDRTVKLWNTAVFQEPLTIRGDARLVETVTSTPDDQRNVGGGDDRTRNYSSAAAGQETRTRRSRTMRVCCVAFSPSGQQIARGSDDGTVKLWDTTTGRESLVLTGHTKFVGCVAFSLGSTRVASGSDDRTVKLWDPVAGQEILTLRGHTGGVMSVAFSPDGKWIVSGSDDGTAQLWETATGKESHTLRGHGGSVVSVAFSPDGTRIASGSWDKTVRLWDRATGRMTRTLVGHDCLVRSVAFSPDGKWIASGNDDGTVVIWNATADQDPFTLRGHTVSVFGVAFSPDGARLASGSDDGTVKLWDTATGQETLTLRGHNASVVSVAFSPDGQRLASASDDWTVRLWEAQRIRRPGATPHDQQTPSPSTAR